MHCVHVKEVAHDSSKLFSRGRHFYNSLLLTGAQRRAWEIPAGAQRRAGTGGLMDKTSTALRLSPFPLVFICTMLTTNNLVKRF